MEANTPSPDLARSGYRRNRRRGDVPRHGLLLVWVIIATTFALRADAWLVVIAAAVTAVLEAVVFWADRYRS